MMNYGSTPNTSRPTSTNYCVLPLLGAFVLRIILMLWSFQHTTHKDIYRFRDWAMIPYLYNLTDPYEGKHITFGIHPLNLPPGTLYILAGMYRVNLLAAKGVLKLTHAEPGALQWVNVAMTNAFLRLPAILSDILIGYLIFALVRKIVNEKSAVLSSGLYLFNPVVLYNGAFWGQMDAINTAAFLFALYCYFRRRSLLSILSLFLSLYVKLTPIFIIGPLMTLWFWLEKRKARFFLYTALSVSAIFALTIPISNMPHIWFYEFLQRNSFGEMNNITSLAFNFWWVVFKPRIHIGTPTDDFSFTLDTFIGSPESSSIFFGMPLFTWAIIITIGVLMPLLIAVMRLREKVLSPRMLFPVLSALSFIGYLYLPHMHERYLFPFFVLMAVTVGLTKKYLWAYVSISLLNFLNMYLVWHPMIRPALPYYLMNSADFQWGISVATLVVGMILYARIIRALIR